MFPVAILTSFSEFIPGYSLTGIVKDQWEMLTSHGHKQVDVFVNENFNEKSYPPPEGMTVKKLVPFCHLHDYRSQNELKNEHREVVRKTEEVMSRELAQYKVVFTHDWIFTGWNLPYFLGIKKVGFNLPEVQFLHWAHSLPGGPDHDWWRIQQMGPNNKIVFPCEVNRILIAEKYHGWADHVRTIPHIKDASTYFGFSQDTKDFVRKNPQILEADILQLLPASVDRLHAKRVGEVIEIFSYMKGMGFKVCLIVAAQWATTQRQKQDIGVYKKQAANMGLTEKEVLWTPDIKPEFEVGIPHRMISELFLLSNLFIFPTREESFGLVVPEAALAGNFLVLNRSLYNQLEITGHNALYFEFGSFEVNFEKPHTLYYQDVAKVIIGRLRENEMFQTKTFCRQRYNFHNLYMKFYAPVMNALIHKK